MGAAVRSPSTASAAEVLAALALATDVATGAFFEKSLQTCLVAEAFATELGLSVADRRVVYQAALLRAIGCTSHAPENAEMFADDVAFQAAFHELDPTSSDVFPAQLAAFGSWAPAQQPVLRQRLISAPRSVGVLAVRAVCEVSRTLSAGLSLDPGTVTALDQVYERWDGRGLPDGLQGEEISAAARIVHIAEQAVLANAHGGRRAAAAEVRRRAGGHLDPDFVGRFDADLLTTVERADLVTAVVGAEPGPPTTVPFGDLNRLCGTFAMVADLKGRWLLGHSTHVADLATGAARLLGGVDPEVVRCTALVHDIGRVAVSSEIWDRPGPLGAGDWERVRLHPYWTARILGRCPATAGLARDAAAHHERCDGSGYPHGSLGTEMSLTARLVAAADRLAGLIETRPYRTAYPIAAAAGIISDDVRTGRLDPDAAAAVLESAGMPAPRKTFPCDLTRREVEVLRLAAHGQTNRQIAGALSISEKTAGHHIAHVYDKTGRRTRAGIAVFAMEHGLLQS